MALDDDILTRLAQAHTRGMTSIRGRRVVRLIRREFAGAAEALCLPLPAGGGAVLGVSPTGAALCATDGRGPEAAVVRWRHGEGQGLKTCFSLLKDSLPATGEQAVPLEGLSLSQVQRLAAGRATLAPVLLAEVEAACQALELQGGRAAPSPRPASSSGG